ncbi:putative recQ-mediated genome instability protein [Helianthus annuus]|nr:putative recQ-mediated genome instability protein [Helianthus annuus]
MSSRRRLRIICSSDEEDDDDIQQPQPPLQQQHDDIESETPNPSIPNPNNPPHPIQIELSDEEFIDATEDSPNSPPLPSSPPPQHRQPVYTSEYSTTSTVGTNQASDSPIGRVLGELGLRLKGEWLDSCLRGLETAVPGFSSLDATQKAKLCFDKFLNADMNYCGAGSLPNNVHQMHLVELPGLFVLQVDEIVNISQHLRERYKKANAGLKRCLKLSMTDGVQRVFGMEYQPIKDLDVLAPAGLKVAISNVTVRHGLIMLVPEVFQVLGGIVEELDAARQRVVTEVNKPPRGRRTRTGVVPPLATRATRAAWPANDPVSQSTTPMQGDNTVPVNGRASSNSAVPVIGRASSNPAVPVSVRGSSNPAVPGDCRVSSNPAGPVSVRASSNSAVHLSVRASSNSAIPISGRMSNSAVPVSGRVPNFAVPNEHQPPRTGVESSVSAHRMNTELFPSTAAMENSVNMNSENSTFTVPIIRETVETTPFRVREETTAPVHLASPVAFSDDDEDVHLVATSREKPFTYLAQLSVKWAESKDKSSHVEGKIKCFVTGVKVFQYKKRSTYELQVYVDDGSLISEILIDHNIVQKKIGYSPDETNTALSSSDQSRVQEMKNIMKQFQVYLVNFEGIMVARINEASSLPVAIEMQQGCSLSDAWSLLGRLKSSNDDQRSQLDPIILSP